MTSHPSERDVLDLRAQFLTHVGRLMTNELIGPKEVARIAGISRRRLVRILDGEADVSVREMARIGLALGVRWNFKALEKKGAEN